MAHISTEPPTIGERIRRRREELDLSRTELGVLANRHRDSIKQIERGRRNPSMRTLIQLAAAMRTTPEDLLAAPALERAS